MNSRRATFVLLLLPAILLERAAYYGSRSILPLALTDFFGLERTSGLQVYGWASTATGFAAILGGVAALVAPRGVLAVAGLVTSIAAMAAFSAGSLFGGLALVVLAAALYKPTMFAWLAEPFAGAGSSVVIAVFLGAYAAINVGAFLPPVFTVGLMQMTSASSVFAVCGGLALLAAGLAGVTLALPAEKAPPDTGDAQAPGRAALLAALAWPGLLAMGLVLERDFSAMDQLGGAATGWLLSMNSLVVILAGIALATGLLVLARAGVQVPFTAAPAAGLVLFAASCSLSLVAPAGSAGELAARMTLGALAEVLLVAPVMSALASASPRLGALLLSVWLALSYLLGSAGEWQVARENSGVMAATTAFVCLVCGGLLAWLTVARRAHDGAQASAPVD